MIKYPLLLALWMVIIFPLWPQTQTEPLGDDPASFIGYSLTDLILRFGVPRSVYPVRGVEEWADDVVFVYDEGDFYIIKDRVWQIGLKSAYLIQAGDSRSAVSLSFGEALSSGWDYLIFPLKGQSWPVALRCNFDSDGRVTVIFIYRSDL
jgi:hypothetical protein